MELKGHFTNQGLLLSAKLATGAALTVTRAVAGSGPLADPLTATALPQPQQELRLNAIQRNGSTALLPTSLLAAEAETDYDLTMVGVFANDPDDGEILYKIYRLSQPITVTAGSSLVLRFLLQETVAQEVPVSVTCSLAGLITEQELDPVRKTAEASAAAIPPIRDQAQQTAKDLVPVKNQAAQTAQGLKTVQEQLPGIQSSAQTAAQKADAVSRIVKAVSAPVKAVTVAAGDLAGYVNGLPRLLTEQLKITVTGTVSAKISAEGFYGPGSLEFSGGTTTGGMSFTNCACPLLFTDVSFVETTLPAKVEMLHCSECSAVTLTRCSFNGNRSNPALWLRGCPCVTVLDPSIKRCTTAVFAYQNSHITIQSPDIGNFEYNELGAHLESGSVLAHMDHAPVGLGSNANYKNGGFIFNRSGEVV